MFTALILTLAIGIVWTVTLGAGTILTWRGLRGKPIDNLPRCSRCKYNVGCRRDRPQRCPECGANLQLLGSIRLGARRMQGRLVTWGVAMVLIGLSPIGALVWRAMPRAIPPPVALAAVPAPAPRPVWNLSPAGRVERKAAARIAADLDFTAEAMIGQPSYGMSPYVQDYVDWPRSEERPQDLHPALDIYDPDAPEDAYGGALVGTDAEPFRVQLQPTEDERDFHAAGPLEREGLSPYSHILEHRNTFTGVINVSGLYEPRISAETSARVGPSLINLHRAGPRLLSGRVLPSQSVLSRIGAPTQFRGASGLNPGVVGRGTGGIGIDLRLGHPGLERNVRSGSCEPR